MDNHIPQDDSLLSDPAKPEGLRIRRKLTEPNEKGDLYEEITLDELPNNLRVVAVIRPTDEGYEEILKSHGWTKEDPARPEK